MSAPPRSSEFQSGPSAPAVRDIESTRAALRKFIERDGSRGSQGKPDTREVTGVTGANDEEHPPAGVLRVAGAAVEAWWEQNPLSVLPKIARPLVEQQVRRYPWQALGLSAAAGAAFVLLKPWRRLPTANLVGALLRTTSVSAVAAAALAAVQESMNGSDDQPPG
jgi:hypothetical protein